MAVYSVRQLLSGEAVNQAVTVRGFVRSRRTSKSCSFIALHDGSAFGTLQIVAEQPEGELHAVTTGAAIIVTGVLVASPAVGQPFEVHAESIEVVGLADAETYPLQKKRHTLEYLRTMPHLRPRTNLLNAVFRLRSFLAQAVHAYFAERGFHYVTTPIITASDCEGAGEQFTVTTLKALHAQTDFADDFFGQQVSLTVSGQLEGEAMALALGKIYTFGPTFRSENSNTSRHLSEFWMIEPEMAFADLQDDMALAEDFVRTLIIKALDQYGSELAFFDQFVEKGLVARLEAVAAGTFAHLTYTEAIDVLSKAPRTFAFPVAWGCDLQSEHERYLSEEYCRAPVFVTDYPAAIKAFYMKENSDGRTVRAMDLLVPGIGEIIGGSQREDNEERLRQRMVAIGVDPVRMDWYLELRRFGGAPHAGFGMGFERFVQYVSGMQNIRDVIPFPRAPRTV
ncbi:asparagine--tRNA ligase [Chrysiogenes arsenatis]|uniref:asparagine--tRNA ligase n=1 Tax=Chrysiogenes arsenatis TaxID=309797 RepID=UPI000408B79D|nr:asparagine--tRNA ligase [Chrysiogenes arsenatis]